MSACCWYDLSSLILNHHLSSSKWKHFRHSVGIFTFVGLSSLMVGRCHWLPPSPGGSQLQRGCGSHGNSLVYVHTFEWSLQLLEHFDCKYRFTALEFGFTTKDTLLYTMLVGYVIMSIKQCLFTATCCSLTQYREGKGAKGSKGKEEEKIHMHWHNCTTGLATKKWAAEQDTQRACDVTAYFRCHAEYAECWIK